MPIVWIALCGIALSAAAVIPAMMQGRKKIALFNGICYGIVVLLIGLIFAGNAVMEKDKQTYDIKGQGLFADLYYDRTEGENYIFLQSQFLSMPSVVIVPKDAAELPAFTKIYKYVVLYRDRNDAVVKIKPNFTVIACIAAFIVFAGLAVYNICMLIVMLTQKLKST